MRWWHPADIGFAIRSKLADYGHAMRLFVRLVALAGPTLRTVPVTTHLPLAMVSERLTSALIEARGRATIRGLQRNFGIADPRLAVAGLNPHAGEDGLMGDEEQHVIVPAVEAARQRRIRIDGPFPGDTVFVRASRGEFDAVIAC